MSTLRAEIAKVRSGMKLNYFDSELSDRAIAADLRDVASEYIRRETNLRKLMASPNIFTTIPCLEMIEVPLAECCTYISTCTIARSKEKIPKVGDNIYGLVIQSVTGIEKGKQGNIKFNYSTPERYSNLLILKTKKDFFWLYNDYLYVTDPNVELVTMLAYFPQDDVPPALTKCNAESPTCPKNPYDEEFKCPSYLAGRVVTTVRENYRRTYKNAVVDVQNDNMDEGK